MLEKLLTISAQSGLTVLSNIFSAVSALVNGLLFSSALFCWLSCGIVVPWFPDKKFLQNSWRD